MDEKEGTMSLNRVILVGRLGDNPQERKARSPMATFSLATDAGKDKKPDWHDIACFGRTAENCLRYLKKGALVIVEGRLTYRRMDNGAKRANIMASSVQFISSPGEKGGGRGRGQRDQPDYNNNRGPARQSRFDDDVPF
jgi:single-strand DNA-binding protein